MPAELYNWFRESSVSPIFSMKSRSATDLAADFQKRQGVNVKTNESGCKEYDGGRRGRFVREGKRKEWGREEENIYGWRGYKTGCSHPDDDNSFLFSSQSRLGC